MSGELMRPANALGRLRAATRAQHERIESALDLMRPDLDPIAYRRFVERSFAFIRACERALDTSAAPEALALRARMKTDLLRRNLRALGVDDRDIEAIAEPDRIPPVRRWPDALGYLYVIEGSTLGGQVLARHCRATLQLPDEAMAFLLSYGREVGPMWKAMLAVLESGLADSSAETAITRTACETFTMLTDWHVHGTVAASRMMRSN